MDIGEVVRLGYEFQHFADLCQLAQVEKRMHALICDIWKSENVFRKIEIHGLDSSSHKLDIALSDFLLCGERRSVETFLFSADRFGNADSVVLYNFDESRDFFRDSVCPRIKASLRSLELHNVLGLHALGNLELEEIQTLKIGLNLGPKPTTEEKIKNLNLKNLKFLEIRGFELCQEYLDWLVGTLASIEALAFLRITFCVSSEVAKEAALVSPESKWKSSDLISLELMSVTETSLSGIERLVFSEFANKVLEAGNGLDNVQTFTYNCSPSKKVWEWLTKGSALMHLVVTNCDKSVDLKMLSEIIKRNARHFQIFVLKYAGSTNIHLDSIIQLILSANTVPPLERLELEVTMDETNCVMETPYHTLKAATTLRCRYRDHMYFFRTKYGVSLASERAFCTDMEFDYSSVTSPMELFQEEMVRGMMDNPADSAALEAELINQWNSIHQIARSIYVEIFDEFVERFITGPEDGWDCSEKLQDSSGQKCDVAATIAHLRE